MRLLTVVPALAFLLTGCIPYAVGTTARTVPPGESQHNLLAYAIPGGIENTTDTGTVSATYAFADYEWRRGLTETSDLGLRVTGASGVVVTWKNRLPALETGQIAVAGIVGGGIVNLGNHLYGEAGLIASGAEDGRVPYGGIRVNHVLPIASGAVRDTPTAGIFGGYRMRMNERFSISPELGIYHDRPALGLRQRSIIFVPSVSFHWD
jgi:hypothetical protein